MGRTKEQRELDKNGKRRCIMCKEIKSKEDDFSIRRYYYNEDGSVKYITYDSRCKSCTYEYQRARKVSSPKMYCNTIIKSIKHRAKKEEISFDLTGDYLFEQWQKQNGKCFYTDKKLDLKLRSDKKTHAHHFYPSVDKQDPKLGYIKGNVVWCVSIVNRMKSNLTHKDFVDFCAIIFNKFGGNNE